MASSECVDCGAHVDIGPELYALVRKLRQAICDTDVKTRCPGCGVEWERAQSAKSFEDEQRMARNLKRKNGDPFEW